MRVYANADHAYMDPSSQHSTVDRAFLEERPEYRLVKCTSYTTETHVKAPSQRNSLADVCCSKLRPLKEREPAIHREPLSLPSVSPPGHRQV
ncbi:hypothetical protein Tdes44962_MAKER03859 [Teratosphaeria destructans]|uniref:Uncharacterized protein n=1 Tax=Teratosphaeria destructans TaxID=418781 RepID=A0A9W7W0T5_9PEZI|nr:hypothetical protein Tdes44962_MAKER03859 [Teratosphaeria destructans]